jgi:hypothetical protein
MCWGSLVTAVSSTLGLVIADCAENLTGS